MSTINTNPINVNYPVPGVNNNSQGFRDNFASIVTNLNAAGAEITDLQNKVVVKQALIGTTINNDMANTLISNASTRSFRATTYNLGNALAGTVLVNVSLADVQYGTISANTTINFGSWAPSGTQSNVQLNLSISNNLSTISFPANVVLSADTGATTLENYSNIAGNLAVTIPNGVSQLNYLVSTTDCGDTLYISPINRPRQSTQIQQRLVPPTGFQGDVAGDVAVDANYIYVCTGTFDSGGANTVSKTITATYSGNLINCGSNTNLVLNAPIVFTGTTWGNIVANTVYYIKSIPDAANITISNSGFAGAAGTTFAINSGTGELGANSFNGTHIWKNVVLISSSINTPTVIQGSLTVDGLLAVSSADNITAAGTVQANATLLTNNINIVSTVNVNSGVILPIAVAGYRIIIRNNSANILNVYPNIGANINAGSIDIPVTSTSESAVEYFCSTSATSNVGGIWYNLNTTYA
jgi:hypothetical protein